MCVERISYTRGLTALSNTFETFTTVLVKRNPTTFGCATVKVRCRCIFQICNRSDTPFHWGWVCVRSTQVLSASVGGAQRSSVCVCVQQLSGCEMAILGHTSGPVWQWARVIIRSQWDAVLFLPRVRCLSGPVSSHLDGWALLIRALAHLPSAPKTNWPTSLL